MGCPPIKAARELGSERRETVDTAVYKSGYLLETPSIPRYSPSSTAVTKRRVRTISREVLWRPLRHDPSETARQDEAQDASKIQSELHGDMQS